jgi:hypothetical protein
VEFIFDNLPVLLIIVATIVIRVLQARAKSSARQNEAPRVFASALEPDDEEEGAEQRRELAEAEALTDYARTRGASAYVAEKARALLTRLAGEETPRAGAFPGEPGEMPVKAASPALPEAEAVSTLVHAPAPAMERNIVPLPGQAPKSPGLFPPRLERLTPLQQAVLWAEILGKPKGMA